METMINTSARKTTIARTRLAVASALLALLSVLAVTPRPAAADGPVPVSSTVQVTSLTLLELREVGENTIRRMAYTQSVSGDITGTITGEFTTIRRADLSFTTHGEGVCECSVLGGPVQTFPKRWETRGVFGQTHYGTWQIVGDRGISGHGTISGVGTSVLEGVVHLQP
jgi:hypothetical protein